MAIQKISFFHVTILFCLGTWGCTSTVSNATPVASTTEQTATDTINSTIPPSMNCLENIHLTIEKSVLLYWAEISTSEKVLVEHAGNERIVIMQDGRYYFSSNSGALQSFDNYFNTDLALHRTLSTTELQVLKDAISALQLEQKPAQITNPDMDYLEGYNGYLYWKNDEQEICKKIDMFAAAYDQIKGLLRI